MQGTCIVLTWLIIISRCLETEYRVIRKVPLSLKQARDSSKLSNKDVNEPAVPDLILKNINRKVYNGDTSEHGDIPFQVHITIRDGYKAYLCGGAILSRYWVVTAAHCIVKDHYNNPTCDDPDTCYASSSSLFSSSAIQVAGGQHHLAKNDRTEQIKNIQLLVAHSSYNPNVLLNDIALLKVESPFEYTDYVEEIELGTELPSGGDTVTVSGWGITEKGGTSLKLQSAVYGVPTREKCEDRYPRSLSEGMWCSGNSDMRTRTGSGDSGGPVFQTVNNTPYLMGVTSWGPSSDEEISTDDYDVNTNIPYYADWIHQHMELRVAEKITVKNVTNTYRWNNGAQAFQHHRLELKCGESTCFILVNINSLHFASDQDAYINLYCGNSIPHMKQPLATITHDTIFNKSYESSSNEMIIEIASGDKKRSINVTLSYIYNIIDCGAPIKRCDEVNDCNDMSDELGCIYTANNSPMSDHAVGCYQGDFKCANGHCTREKFVCDGYDDCHDWSDEDITICSAGIRSYFLNLLVLLSIIIRELDLL